MLKSMGIADISIHAPPRGATRGFRYAGTLAKHFNSRPSARGDFKFRKEKNNEYISIHAPPRGATTTLPPCWKATSFQFTPLREGRRDKDSEEGRKRISIHAPPRGATGERWPSGNFAYDFNSRPSARGDRKRYAISANLLFNPYKSAWLNNRATQFVEIILVIFHRIIA